VSLGVTNASFVAQTAEWAPAHLYATLRAAYHHPGLAFVRILQRCPVYTPALYQKAVQDPARITLLVHDDGVVVPDLEKVYRNQLVHDPRDLDAARRLPDLSDSIYLGILFRDPARARYEEIRHVPPRTAPERIALLNAELDRYAV
jgi:2-oxoglutarate ferredoxin oxidoreductase subunit beta